MTISGHVYLMARKFWGMVFAKISKFRIAISDVKMAHSRHLPIEVSPLPPPQGPEGHISGLEMTANLNLKN